jgi:hypothetical protein
LYVFVWIFEERKMSRLFFAAMAGVVYFCVVTGAEGALVHRWGFDDPAGSTTAVDSVGGNTGILRGKNVGSNGSAAYIDVGAGIAGDAVRLQFIKGSPANSDAVNFAGENTDAGHVALDSGVYNGGAIPGLARPAKAVTMAGWFKINQPALSPGQLIPSYWMIWSTALVNNIGSGYPNQAKIHGGGVIDFRSMDPNAKGPATATPHIAPNVQPGFNMFDDQWHHIVWTQSAGNPSPGYETVQKVYIDGVIAANGETSHPSATIDLDSYSTKANLLVLGGAIFGRTGGNVPVGAFDGWIDEFRIYDEALGDAEVAELYNNPGLGFGGPIVAAPLPSAWAMGLVLTGMLMVKRRRRAMV